VSVEPAVPAHPVPLPVLRRLPVPVAEPRPALRVVGRHDPAGGRRVAGEQAMLELEPPTPVAPLTGVGPVAADDAGAGPAGGPDAGSPPAACLWARQFLQAALEVSAGRRPVTQLVRWTTEDVFAVLGRRAALASRLARPRTVKTATVRSVRLCEVRPGVVEVAAVVADRSRARAVALRLEDDGGRWRVTALEFG